MFWEESRGQSSGGMTSAAAITEGKDLETSNPPQAHHPCVPLRLGAANLLRVRRQPSLAIARICLFVYVQWCLGACLYACAHVRGDKRALDVSRGERLWNMESSRVVLRVTLVL